MPQIDTLATARRLELAGLPVEHARAVSEAIADAIKIAQPDLSNLATKADIAAVKADIANLAAESKTDLKELELRIVERLRSQMIWVYSVQAAFLGIGLAIAKLLFK